jgi:hypothetical protein
MKEILQKLDKFEYPDFSNEELMKAFNHFTLLCDMLSEHGKLYELVLYDAKRKLHYFSSELDERNIK